MTGALLAGAAFGLGVLMLARALFPSRPPLAAALARLDRPGSLTPPGPDGTAGGSTARLAALARALGVRPTGNRSDLAVTGTPADRHLADKVALAVFGLALPAAAGFLAAFGGLSVPVAAPVWASLALGAAGFVLPDALLRGRAAERRRDFRHGLGSFLDLLVVSLAGGAGVESALEDAADIGSGWAFARLRHALAAARVRRETPWKALRELGEELGIAELVELAASVSLAGTEGARVRASLVAKARSLRAHALAEAKAEAHAATERMSLPLVLLFAGFLVFIGYPAIDRVVTGI